jgi:alpha-tubulin suppressor-like RCC1 family protein
MRACSLLCCWSAACLLACSQTIGVLAPRPAEGAHDAGRDAGASDARSDAATPDAGKTASACEGCGVGELCAVDHCVSLHGVTSLSAWLSHACEVSEGRLLCWGKNDLGQLGLGDVMARSRPTRVGSFNDWLAVAAGEHQSCALRAPGRLYCWGSNDAGQLGLGDVTPRLEPAALDAGEQFMQVACGGDACCALHAGGLLFCWGSNLEGQPGQGDRGGSADVLLPAQVGHANWQAVGVGQGHACAIRDDGTLWCWGRNTDLELGLASSAPEQVRAPTQVGSSNDWRAVSGSQHHSCGTRGDGSLYCWGSNPFLELGAPADTARAAQPLRVGSDGDWASVITGWFHTCALKRDGRLYCWGRAIEGQLAQGGIDPIATPSLVARPDHWQRFALGNFFTLGIDASGALYGWGENDVGQLGLGDAMRRAMPATAP